jgi:nucleotide-binding universal stress UspA family protein
LTPTFDAGSGAIETSDIPAPITLHAEVAMQIARILVPLDTSRLAEQALPTVGAMARAANADVRLVLVHQPRPAAGYPDAPWNAAHFGTERTYLDDTARGLSRDFGIHVSTQHPNGPPAESAIEAATEWGADLVVIATHGRTGVARAWAGSMADRVMRSLDVPVLMLRAASDASDAGSEAPRESHGVRRILIPLDGSSRAERIIESALAVGGRTATYVLVRAVPPVPLALPYCDNYAFTSASPVDVEATNAAAVDARRYLERVAHALTEHGVPVGATIVGVTHRAASLVTEAARAHRVDLIALASHGRNAARFVLGSVTDDLLKAGTTPLLVCRRSAAEVRRVTRLPLAHEVPLAVS